MFCIKNTNGDILINEYGFPYSFETEEQCFIFMQRYELDETYYTVVEDI